MEFLYKELNGNHYLDDGVKSIAVRLLTKLTLPNNDIYMLFIDKNRPILYVGMNMSPMTVDYKVVKVVAMGLTALSDRLLSAKSESLNKHLEFKVCTTKCMLIKSNTDREGTKSAFFIRMKNSTIYSSTWFPIPAGYNDKYFKAFNHFNKKPIIGVNLKDELVQLETINGRESVDIGKELPVFKIHNVSLVGSYEVSSKKINIAGDTYQYSCDVERLVPTSYLIMSVGKKYDKNDISVLKFRDDMETPYITKIECCNDKGESTMSANDAKNYLYADMKNEETISGSIRITEKPLTKSYNLTDSGRECHLHTVNPKASKGFDIEVIDEVDKNNMWFGCVNHNMSVSMSKDIGVNIVRDSIVSIIQDHGNGYMLIITKQQQGDMFKYQLTRIKTIITPENLIDFRICRHSLGVFDKSKKLWLEHSIDNLEYILIYAE